MKPPSMQPFRDEVDVAPATFTPHDAQGKPRPKDKITVHFNPASLQLQLTNALDDKGGKTTEHVKTSSAKLTMDLIFDTTDTLKDVREDTQKLVNEMTPKKNAITPLLFEWGTFTFKGIIETYKETLDFFSATGVPLRASVNLTLSHRDLAFGDEKETAAARKNLAGNVSGEEEPVETGPPPPGAGVTSVAKNGDTNGTDDTGRDLAAHNGLESMRFPDGPLVVSPGVTLGPPVAFAAGGAGIAAGAGAAFGASAGAGAAAGFGAGASAGFGAGACPRSPRYSRFGPFTRRKAASA